MRDGSNVDVVALGSGLPFPDDEFQVVVSTEMLEHDLTFWLSLGEMVRVLRPGGFLMITARGNGFPTHDYPADYYRFSTEAMAGLFDLYRVEVLEIRPDPDPASPGVVAIGRKR